MLAARILATVRTTTGQAVWKQSYLFPLLAPLQRIKDGKSFSTVTTGNITPEEAKRANWEGRVDLAAAFRGLEMLNFHEGICNHLSLIVPAANGDGNVMLMNPYGHHWSEFMIEPEYCVGLNNQGEVVEGKGEVEISAKTIHLGIHKTRPDAKCVFHLHPPNATALGMLKDLPFDMYHQNSSLFYNDFAYDRTYGGLSLDVDEGQRIAKNIGNKLVLFMCNHGVMVVGSSVANVFHDVYYLERACMYQVIAMSTGRELHRIPDEICKMNKESQDKVKPQLSGPFFDSIKRSIGIKK
ncbi:hypothetical protein QZH41_020760 [Actinostola sp. cb2023]|nr:hypothetical protein QZH41_020760 [Actinostola sp. cb2023]